MQSEIAQGAVGAAALVEGRVRHEQPAVARVAPDQLGSLPQHPRGQLRARAPHLAGARYATQLDDVGRRDRTPRPARRVHRCDADQAIAEHQAGRQQQPARVELGQLGVPARDRCRGVFLRDRHEPQSGRGLDRALDHRLDWLVEAAPALGGPDPLLDGQRDRVVGPRSALLLGHGLAAAVVAGNPEQLDELVEQVEPVVELAGGGAQLQGLERLRGKRGFGLAHDRAGGLEHGAGDLGLLAAVEGVGLPGWGEASLSRLRGAEADEAAPPLRPAVGPAPSRTSETLQPSSSQKRSPRWGGEHHDRGCCLSRRSFPTTQVVESCTELDAALR